MKTFLTILLFCFASIVKAQDTSYITYSVTHDTLKTTTIPERIIHTGDSSVLISDTSYPAFNTNEYYTVVDGSITVSIPLYDTIVAHDTTFTCSNCTTHDTTVMVITPHHITVRAANQSKLLGSTFTFTHDGTQLTIMSGSLKPGDIITVDNEASTGTTSTALSGSYTITLSSITIMRGVTDVTSSYVIGYQTGTLTVSQPISITIKADNQGKTAGQVFTFLHDGSQVSLTSGALQAGDVITIDNAASSGSGSGAAAGSYAITLSSITIMNGATNVTFKYTITYQSGTLTVAAAPLIITVAAKNQNKQFGSTFTFLHNGSQVILTSGGLASGDAITVDNAASSGTSSGAAVGSYTITLSSITIMNGATNVTGNYTITYSPGTLTVMTIPIMIRANNQSKTQGSTFTFLHNGSQVSLVSGSLQSGDAITVDNAASTGSASSAVAGTYAITLTSASVFNGATNHTGNYTISYQTGSLTVTAPTTSIIYGAFILNSFQSSLAQKIHQSKSIASLNKAYRYNTNRGDNFYSVKQIQDSGLLCAMTFNNRPVQDVAYFPTGAALTAFTKTLDSLLTIRKPDLLSIENEEGNTSYHKGTVQDYLAELNASTTVAHAHNIPISNGGTTLGAVYALRKYYQDNNLTDSVTWLNTAMGLNPSNTSYAQSQLDWYIPLLAGIAASNIDYINFHWYEPPRTDTLPTTTSAVLPPLINYLRIATGKPVITTEAGCRNSSTPLLFQMFNEITQAGCVWAIYYDGVGPLAFQNEAGWRAYLLK
jgi:hypothetical protein